MISQNIFIPVEVYLRKIVEKFQYKPVVTLKNDVVVYNKVYGHSCMTPKCSFTFHASPRQVLELRSSMLCIACGAKSREKSNSERSKSKTEKKIAKKYPELVVLEFNGHHKIAKFQCVCTRSFKLKASALLKAEKSDARCLSCVKGKALEGSKVEANVCSDFFKGKVLESHKKVIAVKVKGVSWKVLTNFRFGKVEIIVDTLNSFRQKLAIYKQLAKNLQKTKYKLELVIEDNSEYKLLPKEWKKWKSVDDVSSYLKANSSKVITILCMDPGVTNHAWSILRVEKPFKVTVEATGMVRSTINDLRGDLRSRASAYKNELIEYVENYGVTHIIAERFQARGIKGATIEQVNQMLGIVATEVSNWDNKNRPVMFITAATWKNEWNRYGNLEEFYTKVSCVNHQVDSIGIGLYGAALWFNLKPFENLKKLLPSIKKQIGSKNYGNKIRVKS